VVSVQRKNYCTDSPRMKAYQMALDKRLLHQTSTRRPQGLPCRNAPIPTEVTRFNACACVDIPECGCNPCFPTTILVAGFGKPCGNVQKIGKLRGVWRLRSSSAQHVTILLLLQKYKQVSYVFVVIEKECKLRGWP
jgi:hypothetical protein